MQSTEKVYSPPKKIDGLPPELFRQFDGDHLEQRMAEAIRLSTVGEDGWPHAAQLSVGECLAVTPHKFLVAIWPHSNTTKNLRRDGRVTMSLVFDKALLEMRGRAELKAENQTEWHLTIFEIALESILEHRSNYADVISGVTFNLHEPEQTLARWREQVACLKALNKD